MWYKDEIRSPHQSNKEKVNVLRVMSSINNNEYNKQRDRYKVKQKL